MALHALSENQKQVLQDDSTLVNMIEGLAGRVAAIKPDTKKTLSEIKKKVLSHILNMNGGAMSSFKLKERSSTFFFDLIEFDEEIAAVADFDSAKDLYQIKKQYAGQFYSNYAHRDLSHIVRGQPEAKESSNSASDSNFGSDAQLSIYDNRFLREVRNAMLLKPALFQQLKEAFVSPESHQVNFQEDYPLIKDTFLYYLKIYLLAVRQYFSGGQSASEDARDAEIKEISEMIFSDPHFEKALQQYQQTLSALKDKLEQPESNGTATLRCLGEALKLFFQVKELAESQKK